MEKSRSIGVIEEKEVRRDDPIAYSFPLGSEVPLESQRR